MQPSSNIVKLRHLLADRFPQLRQGVLPAPSLESFATGVPALDALLGGGLPRGEFIELVGAGDGSGSAQVIHALLRQVAADGQFLALVDGADSFDVHAVDPGILARLLWVRCAATDEALKALDLLLRDRNFPLVVLDLKLNPVKPLRKIPTSTWYRLARLLEQNHAAVLVVTPFQLVGGACCRVGIDSKLGIDAMTRSPVDLLANLHFTRLHSARGQPDTTNIPDRVRLRHVRRYLHSAVFASSRIAAPARPLGKTHRAGRSGAQQPGRV